MVVADGRFESGIESLTFCIGLWLAGRCKQVVEVQYARYFYNEFCIEEFLLAGNQLFRIVVAEFLPMDRCVGHFSGEDAF